MFCCAILRFVFHFSPTCGAASRKTVAGPKKWTRRCSTRLANNTIRRKSSCGTAARNFKYVMPNIRRPVPSGIPHMSISPQPDILLIWSSYGAAGRFFLECFVVRFCAFCFIFPGLVAPQVEQNATCDNYVAKTTRVGS